MSDLHIDQIKIGLQDVKIYNIKAVNFSFSDGDLFFNYLESLMHSKCIVFIEDNLEKFGVIKNLQSGFRPLECLADSITNCVVLEKSKLTKSIKYYSEYKYIVIPKGLYFYIQSKLNLHDKGKYLGISSFKVYKGDFKAYKHFFNCKVNIGDFKELNNENKLTCYSYFQVGITLGSIHSDSIIHGDSHPSNYIVRSEDGKAVIIDYGEIRMLYRTLKSEVCATDLIPLLSNLPHPEAWSYFKAGYISKYGDKARFVINHIEFGDELIWLHYSNLKQYGKAIEILREKLKASKELGFEDSSINNNLGYLYAEYGQYDLAIESYKKATENLTNKSSVFDKMSIFNLARAYYRKKDWLSAAKYFEEIANSESEDQNEIEMLGLTKLHLIKIAIKMDEIEKAKSLFSNLELFLINRICNRIEPKELQLIKNELYK